MWLMIELNFFSSLYISSFYIVFSSSSCLSFVFYSPSSCVFSVFSFSSSYFSFSSLFSLTFSFSSSFLLFFSSFSSHWPFCFALCSSLALVELVALKLQYVVLDYFDYYDEMIALDAMLNIVDMHRVKKLSEISIWVWLLDFRLVSLLV